MNSTTYNTDCNNTNPIYTLGVISKLSNISSYSIRQYIDKGLIIPLTTNTDRHLFSNVDLFRLKCIRYFLNEIGLNTAGIKALLALIPCWKIIGCSKESRTKCEAYYSNSYPCWEASQKDKKCRNEDCRVCEVYRYPEKFKDVKSLFRKLI